MDTILYREEKKSVNEINELNHEVHFYGKYVWMFHHEIQYIHTFLYSYFPQYFGLWSMPAI